MAEKLIRDNIPDIAEAAGQSIGVRIADTSELNSLFRAKILEEAAEVCDAVTGEQLLEELGDLIETAYGLARVYGFEPSDIHKVRRAKLCRRGGFLAGYVLRKEDT